MEPNEAPDSNELYPLNLRCPTVKVNDLRYLYSQLEKASPSLFVKNSNDCRVGVFEAVISSSQSHIRNSEESVSTSHKDETGQKKFFSTGISSLNEMQDTLKRDLPLGSTRLLILNRFNSWSRMTITLEMFRALCTFDQIMPLFLNFIFGFGRKTKSFDEDYMACYHQFSTSEDARIEALSKNRDEIHSLDDNQKLRANSYDLCYNIRHFELHGRDLEDPWSCRQSALHQKYYFTTGRSNWIIVQPPELFSTTLKGLEPDQTAHPMDLHILYLGAAMANWRPYLNHMTEKLTELDGKVSFSKPFKEFEVTFSFSQRIHVLRKKLNHARCILENTRDTLASIGSHAQKVAQISSLSISQTESLQSKLGNVSSELNNHLSTTCKLLRFSEDIRLMNNDILRFRDQELLYDNGLALARIGQADALERETMVILANGTARDSRTTRLATVIAVLYLPANLVMAFFSSNLIELNSTNNSGQGGSGSTGILVHRQIWIAILTILVLTSFTLLPTVYYDRRGKGWRRSARPEEPGTELPDFRSRR